MALYCGPKVLLGINAGEGPWFVQMYGIRRTYTWQDLKDMVRPAVPHVGHVEMYSDGRATFTVRKFDEAIACFERLSSGTSDGGRRLYVELWETTPNCAPRLIWKTAESIAVQARQGSGPPPQYSSQLAPPRMPTYQEEVAQRMAYMQISRQSSLQAQQPAYQAYYQQQANTPQAAASATMAYQRQLAPQQVHTALRYATVSRTNPTRQPNFARGPTGIPTNIDHGTIRTERRGIFVHNLSFDVQSNDIQRLFGRYGTITDLTHNTERKPNPKGKMVERSKGTASITYATKEQASAAREALNGYNWNGRKLTVRYDTETTPVEMPPSRSTSPGSSSRRTRRSDESDGERSPLIVDGSAYSRR